MPTTDTTSLVASLKENGKQREEERNDQIEQDLVNVFSDLLNAASPEVKQTTTRFLERVLESNVVPHLPGRHATSSELNDEIVDLQQRLGDAEAAQATAERENADLQRQLAAKDRQLEAKATPASTVTTPIPAPSAENVVPKAKHEKLVTDLKSIVSDLVKAHKTTEERIEQHSSLPGGRAVFNKTQLNDLKLGLNDEEILHQKFSTRLAQEIPA